MRSRTDHSRSGRKDGAGDGLLPRSRLLELTVARSRLYLQTLQPHKDGRVGIRLEALMRDAGFVNIESRMMPLPLCGWPDSTWIYSVSNKERLTLC